MEDKLPEIEIYDTIFQFDIDKMVFIKKDDPSNMIFIRNMFDNLTHYEYYWKIGETDDPSLSIAEDDIFNGSEVEKKIYRAYNVLMINVKIPRIGEIDPEGMMRKYGCSLEDIKNKTDFEIIVNQDVLKQRMAGETVKIDVGGKVYHVDALEGTLLPVSGSEPSIKMAQFQYDYYIEDEGCYYLYCNMDDGRIVDILRDQTVENTIVYTVPHLSNLDPIPVINSLEFLTDLELYYHDLKMNHTAEAAYQEINANSLLRSDFTVKRPELETLILIADNDPNYILREYRDYIIADKKCKGCNERNLTVIFEKNKKPYGGIIVVPNFIVKDNDPNHPSSGIREAMLHIDILTNKQAEKGYNISQSCLLTINKYLELYHSPNQRANENSISNIKRPEILPKSKRNGPKI